MRHHHRQQPSPLEGKNSWEKRGATAARFNSTNVWNSIPKFQFVSVSKHSCCLSRLRDGQNHIAQTPAARSFALATPNTDGSHRASTALPSQNTPVKTQTWELGSPRAVFVTRRDPTATLPPGGCCHGKRQHKSCSVLDTLHPWTDGSRTPPTAITEALLERGKKKKKTHKKQKTNRLKSCLKP